ncbi:AbrB/MazE/SpoVT family DNA-binding domain-containing protein [bacterium]|nr:AbrB/MazE/SpoVT family DNA-binding domain-containing protein [bacterium]
MTYTQVSQKFQIVIPKEIRNKLSLKPKQKLMILEKNGVIYMAPDVALSKTFGLFKNSRLTSANLRDKKDRV